MNCIPLEVKNWLTIILNERILETKLKCATSSMNNNKNQLTTCECNGIKWQPPKSTFKTSTSGIPYQQYLVPWQHSTHKAVALVD